MRTPSTTPHVQYVDTVHNHDSRSSSPAHHRSVIDDGTGEVTPGSERCSGRVPQVYDRKVIAHLARIVPNVIGRALRRQSKEHHWMAPCVSAA